jgi:hypothetical protein
MFSLRLGVNRSGCVMMTVKIDQTVHVEEHHDNNNNHRNQRELQTETDQQTIAAPLTMKSHSTSIVTRTRTMKI